ncbi:ankyrin repeat and fibronectin type-III domain-containing protein 1 isoform X3 [Eupeodes corollae]|uniref:ankyrin repeat and fibronectin type-III domain-containing protein 1 isoform X3 n=1 Tax=Eupeodes corollae TaxID=290404 RepID=UPI0024909B81|nr:ankyrin repeat and fibronectin type-III domain-containing protein 1 isoform X3 [Eupeodes corollae]
MKRWNNAESSKPLQIGKCLRSPVVLLRQKSFGTLADIRQICHAHTTTTSSKVCYPENVLPDLLSKSCCEKSLLASNNRHSQPPLHHYPSSAGQDEYDFQKPNIRPQRSKRHLDFSKRKNSTTDNSRQSVTYDFYTETSPLFNKIPVQLQHHHASTCQQFEMEYLVPNSLDQHHHQQQPQQQQHQSKPGAFDLNKNSWMKYEMNTIFLSRYPKENHLATNQENEASDKMQPQQRVLQRGSTSKGGSNQQPHTPHPNKLSKKQLKIAQAQLDKLTQINTHLHALFSAVEHGHLDKARTILESTDVDVNSINADGLSPLDVAVLSNNRSMTKMLLQHGAIEGSQFATESLGNKLNGLLQDAESRIQDLSGCEGFPQSTPFTSTRSSISSIIIGNSGPSVTGCTGTETDKQIGIWERRVKGLRRMLLGWDQARPPDSPMAVGVDVIGVNSIMVRILEPTEGAIGTKFKVQWSTRADFSNVVGEREILEWNSFQGTMGANCRISDLTQGRRYFIRACCGNVKGWGPSRLSVPASVVPSSWRDLTERDDRFMGRLRILDSLFTAVRLARPEDASELTLESSAAHRRNPKKKTTIKQLFSVTSKFQKHLRRGIYLACILYYEDKVLVTSEDCIPVIEIDETYPSSLHSDYHWFMKVACTWEDVKSLRTDMERHLTSAVHFRTKLLSAACQMQSALCLTDLGQLFHKPLRDSHGTVVLCCVNSVKTQKSISVLNSRWLPVNKIQKKITALHEDYNINEMLISSISDQILYHQTSTTKINPGLYLGYLKMQCSVDQIQVVVPVKTPNVLPHAKVRENSHITADEWEILTKQNKSESMTLEFTPNPEVMTEVQKIFLNDITQAANTLFKHMNIRPEEALNYRLYDIEIIELSKDISFLIICPPVESSCAVPGQTELLLQRDDLLSLTIQAFEMIHLRTYQNGIIQKYSRLSCILELDTALANHSHREAFSTSELQIAKERLAKLQELTLNLNSVWKSVRWLMDVIAFARDRSCNPTVTIREILDFKKILEDNVENSMCDNSNCHLLQLPVRDTKFSKSGPGRGSWPGPAANSHLNSECYLAAEHSKSEQNLGCVQPQQFLHPKMNSKNDECLRKNSADSTCSQYTQSFYSTGGENSEQVLYRMPPSRSEDTLSANNKLKNSHFRKRTTMPNVQGGPTSNSAPYLSVSAHSSSCQTNITDSVQSLSSDSETASYPIAQRVKLKTTAALKDGGLFLKSTLNALQTEIKGTDAKVHCSEPSSPVSNKSNKRPIPRQASAEDCTLGNSTTALASSISHAATSTSQQTGIIQVFTAYDTGLASGTSLKLNVTPKTTAREVINLVVKQINTAVVLKGNNGPIYTSDKLNNFCLVAVIGARERCLRDDFKPLQLQNPWKKGRLYVRQKHELLAAIEHSNRKSHLI